jgi:hypothetical protein
VRSLWLLYAVLAVLLQMLSGLGASPACASPLPNGDRIFLYAVIYQKLSDVLAALGDQIGVNVNVSDGVKGHIRGRLDGSREGHARSARHHLPARLVFLWRHTFRF